MRLAIVDDSAAVRSRLVAMLGEIAGVEIVGEARDGEEALALLASRGVDAVLLDLHLPRTGGLEVLRRMADTDRPMVIVLTNHPTEHHRAECMRLGADFFFDKAKDVERVLAVLRDKVAASRRAH